MSTPRPRGLPYGLFLALALAIWLLAPASAFSLDATREAPATVDAPAIDHRDVGAVTRALRAAAPCTAAAASARDVPADGNLAPAPGSVAATHHGPPLYTLFRVYRL